MFINLIVRSLPCFLYCRFYSDLKFIDFQGLGFYVIPTICKMSTISLELNNNYNESIMVVSFFSTSCYDLLKDVIFRFDAVKEILILIIFE